MFDLGLDLNYFENLTAVTENIQFLEQRVWSGYDHGLLWRITGDHEANAVPGDGWHFVYMILNERQDREKATNLRAKVKESIRRWNKADVFLFNYF